MKPESVLRGISRVGEEARVPRSRGFSLIELMITVVVIGILSAIAYPSYQNYLIKGRRASAQAHVMNIAQRQQQYLLDARNYAPDLATLNVTTPSDISPFYTITIAIAAGPPPTFTATATPKAGTPQATDVTLSINNAGAKTPASAW